MFTKFLSHTLARDFDKLEGILEPRFLKEVRAQSE